MNVEFKLGKVSKILLISFIVLIVFYGLISSFSVKIEGTRKFSSSFFDTFNLVTGLAVEPQIEVKLKNKYGGEVGFYDLKEGKLIFGLDNSSFNSIVYLSGEQEELTAYLDLTSDNGISTQVISLENIGFSNAIIILEKNNPITSIVKCASFDLGAFSCREWEKLNLEFIEDEKTIRFEVDEKGVYAGYFSLEDLKPEQIKIDIKNKYGNDIIEPNLTDQGFFVEANNSKIELNGVESTMVSVFLDNVQNETIKTSVVYIPSINLDNATVILPKNGNVDVIYKCEYFDLGGFNCLNWVKTNILFEDLGDKILFNVNSFSAYAGGILGAVLALKIGEKKYIEVRNFREQDGGYMLALRPLQYFDNDWKDLYPVNNLSDVDYSHLIVKPNYNILISRDTKKSLMHLKMEDTYVNYALENSLNSIPEFITDNEMQIVFKNIQENTDLRYTLSDKNIKEDIVLKQFGKNRFRFILDNAQGVKVDKKEDGTYKIYDAVNSSMEATVLRPFMYDAVNKRSDAVDISLFVEDSNLILDLIANSSWLESASYPVIIDPTFSVVANSTNAFSCQTNNVTMECRPARNIINFTTTSDVAVLDFNLSNLIIPSTENITAITLQLFCNGSVSNTFSLINVTTPAKIRNETANISGLHQDVMGSSTFLNQNFILSCTNQLTNITFSDTGINEIKKIYNNSNTNLRYYPIGINQTSISVATNSFDNELGSFSPVLYFNTTTSDCGNLNVAGVYTLNNNVNAPGTCFNITSSNVELNCAGFQINYSHKSLGFAVNATNVNNVTIRDCNILQGSNASVNHAVLFTNLTNGSLLNSTIMTIGTDVAGFFATTNTTGVLINGSNITSRQGFAINFTGSSNATITFNNITVSSNDFGSEAIRLDSGNNFTIKSNVIYCARECIRVRGVNFTIIETIINNNNITFNGTLDAIFLQGSKNITISNNNITSTRTDATAARGVRISSSDNVIANNTIRTNSSNTAYAILIEEGSKNKIISNILNSSGATAIFLGPDGDYNVFENNTILQSGNNAFEINGADGGNQMPENNNFTNNTLNNIQNKDLVISDTGINGTRLIDQNIRNYTFTGIGSLIVVKNSTFGEISFFQQVNGSGVNLVGNSSSDIQFSNNSIFVISNSSGNIGLNRSANITIFGTPGQRFINHKILRDGVTCNATTSPSCSNFTALTAVTVIFNVTAFSNYSIGGDTNNTLITCGNINTAGNYSLGNSVNAPGTCFNITASNVELNCGGFEINYSQSSLGFAINVSNVNNVTIKNCNILQGAVISSSNAINFANITNGSLLNTTIETFGLRANGFTAETNSTGILINGSNITIHEGIVINFTESANSSITNNNMTSIVDAGGLVILIGRGVNFTISNN
ncbi:right-handed parallel beta-helix repeat-containing protein, partial [Candidatus Woesearchaeota archaeon]|nr:right-handed parallel beta-helix repeat-containing protein [Candidatus Woesearchaeota archaeon]